MMSLKIPMVSLTRRTGQARMNGTIYALFPHLERAMVATAGSGSWITPGMVDRSVGTGPSRFGRIPPARLEQ